MGMDSFRRYFGPANVVGLLRQQSEGFEMNIEHKTTPVEHWIVDGKAYRLANAEDIGKLCCRSDTCIGEAIRYGQYELTGFEPGEERPYVFGIEWRFAYIQDDSLLTPPEATPPTKPIDWTKPVRTKDGRAVRVLCTDGPGECPVVGILDGVDGPECWHLSGSYFESFGDGRDLENTPQRIQREYWVNVYTGHIGGQCKTQAIAKDMRENGCLACVKITIDCEEGEGL